jgi:predicted dehydrogenase
MYIRLDFEKGSVIWDQENPNHFIVKLKDGSEKRYERHSDPGMIGRPSGHPHGYGDAMLIEIDEFLATIESGDEKRIRDYSRRNVKHSRDAVEMIKQWTSTPLIERDAEDSTYVAEHRKAILGR